MKFVYLSNEKSLFNNKSGLSLKRYNSYFWVDAFVFFLSPIITTISVKRYNRTATSKKIICKRLLPIKNPIAPKILPKTAKEELVIRKDSLCLMLKNSRIDANSAKKIYK